MHLHRLVDAPQARRLLLRKTLLLAVGGEEAQEAVEAQLPVDSKVMRGQRFLRCPLLTMPAPPSASTSM